MNMRYAALIAAVCLSALGCRQDPHVAMAIDSLNAEKRLLEDVVWEQEYDYEDLLQKVEQLEEENRRLRRGERDDSSAPPSFDLSPRRGSDENDEELAPPTIEFGAPAQPGNAPARPQGRSLDDDELEDQPPLDGSNGAEAAAPEEIGAPVAHLHINPLHTSGADFDHKPGDDGLTVVVEPRTANGSFTSETGSLSIVLLDPTIEGEAARVARWDIDDEAANQAMHTSKSARGIRLDLPWPEQPPTNSKLRLFVRMETPTGSQIEADQDVFVTLPGKFSQRWTPRPIDRPLDKRGPAAQIAGGSTEQGGAREPAPVVISPQRVSDARGAATPANAPPTGATSEPQGALKRPQWQPYR